MLALQQDRGPLLGRAPEIEVLTGLLDDVERRGSALVLRGDPGIGKSRLLSEAVALAEERQMRVLATTGVQSEAQLAFAGLQALLRPVRSQAARLPAAHQAVLDAALGLGDDRPPERFRIAMAVLDVLTEVATDRPFDTLGCASWADQARRELRASGESSRRRDPSLRDELTAQEIQIAHLAAEGFSNRQIGEKLFVSPRTVSTHLYRIYPKLGVTARGELASALEGGS